MKNVQIPYDLFIDLLHYHLVQEDDYAEDIWQGLEEKLDAMVRHELYVKYKTAQPRKNESRQGWNIWTDEACLRVSDGKFPFVGNRQERGTLL